MSFMGSAILDGLAIVSNFIHVYTYLNATILATKNKKKINISIIIIISSVSAWHNA